MNSAQLIEALSFCEKICNSVFNNHASAKQKTTKQCLKLVQECADICNVCIIVVEENSKDRNEFLKLCAEITKECAEECAKQNIDLFEKCIAACSNCSEMCERHLYAI